MKTRAVAVVLLVVACGGPDDGQPSPESPAAPTAAPPPAAEVGEVATESYAAAATGWVNATTCNGSQLAGYFIAHLGLGTPALMGAVQALCRPPRGSMAATCWTGGDYVFSTYCPKPIPTSPPYPPGCLVAGPTFACTVYFETDGGATLTHPAPSPGIKVSFGSTP